MNLLILHKEVQEFINDNLETDTAKLLFKKSPFSNITIQELVAQIEAKKRCKKKLPNWFATQNIYYPNKLHIEQTSSEVAASYKSSLISGNSLIDITGGLGVDAYYFSKNFKDIIHCENNEELSKIATHNFKQLRASSIKTLITDGIQYLKLNRLTYDCIYIDPSRRNDIKGKVFLLKDCLPNVPENLDVLFEHTDTIMIKASPILDITSALNELKFVKEIHIVAIENEVKELLFILYKGYTNTAKINSLNIKKSGQQHFEGTFGNIPESSFSTPLSYLYEPNAAILKGNLQNEVSNQLIVFKIHNNSHLYTSNKLVKYPGRSFKIVDKTKFNKKELVRRIPSKKAHITTRNFPETVAQIRKKIGFTEGGNHYLFFTTDINNNRIVLICEKI